MDSLTHLVLGAAIGEALLGKQLGKKAMLWGALADTIPDFDVFFVPLFKSPDSLLVHRGITHSLLFALVLSPVLGKLFSRFNFKRQTSFRSWTLLFFAGMLTHIVLDSFTAYGTGWFEPFSHYRVTFNTIFVADLFYTVPFLICVVALLILRSDSSKRKKWNRAGLFISTGYLLFTFVNKWYVDSAFKNALGSQHIVYTRYFSTPTPLNNILWMGVAEDSAGYHVGYFSDLDKDKNISFHYFPRNERLLAGNTSSHEVGILKWFADDYYTVTGDSTLRFNNLKHGQIGGWADTTAPFAFSYELNNDGKQKGLDRGRFKGSVGEVFNSLVKRIKGK